MRRVIIFTLSILVLSGCASTKSVDVMTTEKITGPKVIAIAGDRGAWVFEIEKRIKRNGFTIKRAVSQQEVTQVVALGRTATFNEATARYVLNIQGYAPNNKMQRCYGGGYNFDYIDAELIDLVDNKTIFHYSNSGYSEGCQPMSGNIFGDISDMLNQSWK
ncbi:TPA: lipoprotein [Serratia marcescens]